MWFVELNFQLVLFAQNYISSFGSNEPSEIHQKNFCSFSLLVDHYEMDFKTKQKADAFRAFPADFFLWTMVVKAALSALELTKPKLRSIRKCFRICKVNALARK